MLRPMSTPATNRTPNIQGPWGFPGGLLFCFLMEQYYLYFDEAFHDMTIGAHEQHWGISGVANDTDSIKVAKALVEASLS